MFLRSGAWQYPVVNKLGAWGSTVLQTVHLRATSMTYCQRDNLVAGCPLDRPSDYLAACVASQNLDRKVSASTILILAIPSRDWKKLPSLSPSSGNPSQTVSL